MLSRQAWAIIGSVAVIAGGSVTAAALTSGSDKPAAPTQQVAAEVSPTPSTSLTAPAESPAASSPTAVSAAPTATALAPHTSPAPPATPRTRSTTKEKTVAQQQNVTEPPTSTQSSAPASQPSAPATPADPNGWNNGGSGTVDHGPYPSQGPMAPIPTPTDKRP